MKSTEKKNLIVVLEDELLGYALEHGLDKALHVTANTFFKENFDIIDQNKDYSIHDIYGAFGVVQDGIAYTYSSLVEKINVQIKKYIRGLLANYELIVYVFRATEDLHSYYRTIVLNKLTNINLLD